MAKRLQLRRGTTVQHATFTGALGEITVDTTKKTLVVHDGVTAGGAAMVTAGADGKISSAQLPLNSTLTSTSVLEVATASTVKTLSDQDFGVGQTWQDVKASRHANTLYTNTTGKPIVVNVSGGSYGTSSAMIATVNGVVLQLGGDSAPYDTSTSGSVIVPVGATYKITPTNASLATWVELR